jgi:hypothetical protein
MNDHKWTPKMVEERIEEAADTLHRLPEQRVRGFFNTWPPVIRDFWEAFGWEDVRIRRGPPQPGAIDRMDDVMIWLTWLEADDVRLVWLRACHTPWKLITRRFGISRTTAWRNWVGALITIAARLDGSADKPGRRSAA